MIHCSNPKIQYLSHKDEIVSAISNVLEKGWYISGEECKLFESEFSNYVGVKFGVGVGSGTEALHVALRACGIGPGHEVITVAHTAVATIAAIELAGATPVLVDIDPKFYVLDPLKIEKAISTKTKAIIPVHLYGLPVDMISIIDVARANKLKVIEDCAQATGAMCHGRRVGSWGDAACFSFYPTKNLGALGDGGMLVTNDGEIAQKAKLLREYGWADRYVSKISGWNSRLDELQAAILRIKLRTLDKDNELRSMLASKYDQLLVNHNIILPKKREESTHVYHLYVIRSSERDKLQQYLKDNGVGSLVHYPVPVHLQPAYLKRLKGSDELVNTEKIANEVLSLPMYPELKTSELATVAAVIQRFMEKK
ncbi:MAG: DegT/DnrJ/EryC1/StrS family aminotransferase [Pseudomonadota bacterium]